MVYSNLGELMYRSVESRSNVRQETASYGVDYKETKKEGADMYPESWTHFLIKLNTWMFPCIEQGTSILFFLEFFCYCNNLYNL